MPGVITQGVREGHPAIDIACITGTPVRAAHDGQGSVRRSRTHGTTFELRGSDGLETSYSHLHTAMPAGFYKRGEQIGTCGDTGIWSSGPHLHFESNRPQLLGSLSTDLDPVPNNLLDPATPVATGGSPEASKPSRNNGAWVTASRAATATAAGTTPRSGGPAAGSPRAESPAPGHRH
jgi:murein DD-endopeptidase MepM/ murein hydrolase activator NlpD